MNSLYRGRISRRRFVKGLVAGGIAASCAPRVAHASAIVPDPEPKTEFWLDITEQSVNYTGRDRHANVVNGQLPGPVLRWKEGTTVTIHVTNHLRESTSIHWHGILLPADMDGVPGLSFTGIAPGETFTYRFPVRQSGTYWYHSHSGFQGQLGVKGAIVIEPKDPPRVQADREHVVMFTDWTDMNPSRLFKVLKKQGDYFNFNQLTAKDLFADIQKGGIGKAFAARKMFEQMRMSPRDISDVSGYAFTYLTNDATPAGNWSGIFVPGERVLLRLINGSTSTFFDTRIPGLKLTVVAADGQDVKPVTVDEIRMAAAETYDVLVEPRERRAYTIFAQTTDRTGYARGTLAPHKDMTAPVPHMDPVPTLQHEDMMGAMGAMHGGGHGDGHHGMMEMNGPRAHHARTEFRNPGVDMRVDWPRTNLDDPGTGLRDNGRRVLTYADLHSLDGSYCDGPITREIELHLTGSMERFIWSFDGVPYAKASPVHFPYGECVRVILCNDTMMNHPIHLHGMWSEIETPDGAFQVRKHTVNVQPAQRVTYRVRVDTRGRWAYHCHLLYHMHAGMFREVVVA